MTKKTKTDAWALRYQNALRRYLFHEQTPHLQPTLKLGHQAAELGMETLALAQIHEHALRVILPPDSTAKIRKRVLEQAKNFFDETNSSIEKTHVAALKKEGCVTQLTKTLLSRTAESQASLQRLKHGISQRKKAEAALVKSGTDHTKILQISNRLRALVREQTHALLDTQEKERKRISQGLQDTVAQTLLGINIELLALKASNRVGTDHFVKNIDSIKQSITLEPKNPPSARKD